MAADQELQNLVTQIKQNLNSPDSQTLLVRAKQLLLRLNAVIPNEQVSPQVLKLSRETLELGALVSIRLKDADSFTRYFAQLQPFYALKQNILPQGDNRSKITGLYLLLLLSSGNYGDFHTQLEKLAQSGMNVEEDECIQYAIRVEQALMEGSYDRVWAKTMTEAVPSEEFKVFSEVNFVRFKYLRAALWLDELS